MEELKNGEVMGQEPTTAQEEQESKGSFFDLLHSNKDYQREFDRTVTKALDTHRVKWDEQAKEARESAIRLAKEQAKHELETERTAFEREKALFSSEQRMMAEGLPVELAGLFIGQSETTLDIFKQTFNTAVERAVKDKIPGYKPGGGGGSSTPDKTRQAMGLT